MRHHPLVDSALLNAEALTVQPAQYFDTLTAGIDAVNALGGDAIDLLLTQVQKQSAAAQRTLWIVVGALAVLAIGGTALTIAFVRAITRPLAQAVRMASDVASGDLSGADQPHGSNEVGQLVQAQQQMRSRLRQLVAQVR